jgi:hypothetical protein
VPAQHSQGIQARKGLIVLETGRYVVEAEKKERPGNKK